METSMTGGRMADQSLGEDRRTLRRSPWSVPVAADLPASEGKLFAGVLGLFEHLGAEGLLAGKLSAMPIEIIATEFVERPVHAPGRGQKVRITAAGQHGESSIADARNGKPFSAGGKLNFRQHHRIGF
ncbi:hypothetical protein FIV06_31505 (plasmid) [Labrenzia sp. THAF191b]|nr:hypothetical protein FIV06_31505 [Labrenzia sp. THAF191b]QFT08371.1 hypothetical protein FIV05_31770 [Labrenzia sp. THAF191a]QFT19839.1 hypothetical protein FIV03_31405 [Labrenzia sp. THAF187b]QFT71193.1 hypothetical protein FIU93_30670 [Labrenzia sp. THAF35]